VLKHIPDGKKDGLQVMQPPPRGCVLKRRYFYFLLLPLTAAAFARLCVETISNLPMSLCGACSHLHAAVC